jgi:hypothetical protein
VNLLNLGPDEPFGGGEPFADFEPSDPETTGQVMQFRVVAGNPEVPDSSADPALDELELPKPTASFAKKPAVVRALSLNELDSETVLVKERPNGRIVEVADGFPFGPVTALLGTYEPSLGLAYPFEWHDPVTENPALGATEVWELYNLTADAHPIHLHQVQFQVVNRQDLLLEDDPILPDLWERGFKDTVIAYPGQVTRIRARFDLPGLYTWHCHILEHEDNEMMRPYHVGPIPPDLPIEQ